MSALFIILVSLIMTLFSEKILNSNRCISGLMPNLIKKSWTVSTQHIFLNFVKRYRKHNLHILSHVMLREENWTILVGQSKIRYLLMYLFFDLWTNLTLVEVGFLEEFFGRNEICLFWFFIQMKNTIFDMKTKMLS